MAKARILIVEDEGIVALEIKDRLQKMGYEIAATICRGEDGFKVCKETSPDLILMDIKLKGPVDGIEAASQIHTELDIPVIYLTAYSNEELIGRAIKTNPFGYIIKPFHEKELGILIELALQKHGKEKQLTEIAGHLEEKVEHCHMNLAEANKRLEAQVEELNRREVIIERNYQIQKIISKVLRTSLEPISLKEQLKHTLELILSVSWLAFQKKGSIFLTVEGKEELEMVAWQGLGDVLTTTCATVSFGHCLCGRAASTKQLVFAGHIDARHDTRFDGMAAHGHYCVPIVSEDNILGVINMYVRHGHKRDERADDFLYAIADTLAGIIERRRAQRRLQHMALYDNLTGIPNRTMFFDRLGQSLALARRNNRMFALLYLDLDKFKHINDTLGHEAGDILLKEAAERLTSCIRESDTAARMGGDEFTVILAEIASEHDAAAVANKIIETLHVPFELKGYSCTIGTSIGICVYPISGIDANVLIKKADMAMYAAKTEGGGKYRFYSGAKVNFGLLVEYAVEFVQQNGGTWDHNAWLGLLFDLQRRGFELSEAEKSSFGRVLESLRPLKASCRGDEKTVKLISDTAAEFIQNNGGTWDDRQREGLFRRELPAKGIKLIDEAAAGFFLESLKALYHSFTIA
ncbi:MAG: diguanylate cyclase [Nitrospirae bacterium]|nr:diguanylate cyclase [Nitrospirota bacterium]